MDSRSAIESVDRILAECAGEIRLFYHLSPTNESTERAFFLQQPKGEWQPKFSYRPLEFPPEKLRKALEEAPVEDIEDGVLGPLFKDKICEVQQVVALLESRNNGGFLERSLELFGRPPPEIVEDARALLASTEWIERRELDGAQVRPMLERHLDAYRDRYPGFDCEVVVEEVLSAKFSVHDNRVHLRREALFSRAAALCDIHHEIDTHVLTFLNGRRQPLRFFQLGPRGSLTFQESLGVFSEIVNGVIYPGRRITLAARVSAVDGMIEGLSFSDVYNVLTRENGIDGGEAFEICVRVFRGGGFTKDWLYLADLERIFRYWAEGRDMRLLLLGKISLEIVDQVKELLERGLLEPARYLPEYLERIAGLRERPVIQNLLQDDRIGLEQLLTPLPD